MPPLTPVGIIASVISVYEVVVLIAAILSWFRPNPRHPFVRMIRNLTEPVFQGVARALPVRHGGFDFSPIVVLLVLELIRRVIVR